MKKQKCEYCNKEISKGRKFKKTAISNVYVCDSPSCIGEFYIDVTYQWGYN